MAAIEPQSARLTAETAANLARRLSVPLVFVSVRPGRSAGLGDRRPLRRWIRDMLRSRKALDVALAAASRNGVIAYGEIIHGGDARAIVEFARERNAQLLVHGSLATKRSDYCMKEGEADEVRTDDQR